MKTTKLLILTCALSLNTVFAQENKVNDDTQKAYEIPVLEGPYLGQKPPGLTPEVFAPGIVNKENSIDLEGMFGSDMNSFYFTREGEEYAGVVKGDEFPYGLAVIEYKNNRWVGQR